MTWIGDLLAPEPITLSVLLFVLLVRLRANWFSLQPVRSAHRRLRHLRGQRPWQVFNAQARRNMRIQRIIRRELVVPHRVV